MCVSAKAALEPWAGGAGYTASKAAVLAFARVVAKEHAADGVRCNVIAPSLIDTPANRAASPDAIDKMVPPERIASDPFLCSDDARVNGVVVLLRASRDSGRARTATRRFAWSQTRRDVPKRVDVRYPP